MISHQKNLPHLFFLNQISTLPVKITQAYHRLYHITSQWLSISQLHHLQKVTLPEDIPPHYHQNKNKSNSLTLSPHNKSPQIYHHYSLWILRMIPMLSPVPSQVAVPVPFQVPVTQIYSTILFHMKYPNIHFQDPISYQPFFQTQYFLP